MGREAEKGLGRVEAGDKGVNPDSDNMHRRPTGDLLRGEAQDLEKGRRKR